MTRPLLEFLIPGAPVPKARARFGRGGHAFTPARTRAYERLVGVIAQARGARPVECLVRLTVELYMPDARIRDASNCAKAIEDGLNGVAYRDDSQIVDLRVTKQIDRAYPRAFVRVERAES